MPMITTRNRAVERIVEKSRRIARHREPSKQIAIKQNWRELQRQQIRQTDAYSRIDPPVIKDWQLHEVLPTWSWRGKSCFIVGGGPSLKDFDFSQLEGKLTIAINRAFERFDPSIIFFMDTDFMKWLMENKFGSGVKQRFLDLRSIKIGLDLGEEVETSKSVYKIHSVGEEELTFKIEQGLGHGCNAGYGALNLAICLGANPIYLLGYDMKGDGKGKQTWWHDGYPTVQREKVYERFMKNFEWAAPQIKKAGFQVINLNPESALKCFDFGTLDVLKKPEINTKTNSVKVSVVMPTYNQDKYIEKAIDGILAQTMTDFELIIVNDGSTDDTEKIIQGFKDPRIKYIKKENGGTGSALNEGFKTAKGKYETWFSSDSVMYPNNLEVLSNALDESSEGLVYGKSDVMNSEGKILRPLNVKPFDRELLLKTCYLGIAYMWKKDLRLKTGGTYALTPSEDFDMFLRMSELTDFKHIPIALAGWRDHPENLTKTTTLPSNWKDHHRFVDEAKARREKPFFTVMTIAFNRPDLLREALGSLNNQTFRNFEVLIASRSKNPKPDKTVVESFKNEHFKWFGQSKLPVYTIRNKMIRKAAGRYITILDDDDLFPSTALQDRYEFILENYAPDFIYTDYKRFGTGKGEYNYRAAEPITADFILKNRGTQQKMVGACLTIWAPILKRMKYDDKLLPQNTGDCELAIRLLKAGLRFKVLNKMTYLYRAHRGQGSFIVNQTTGMVQDIWNKILVKHSK
jgi:glycosyltransferase involved in cell wall biosynthesis